MKIKLVSNTCGKNMHLLAANMSPHMLNPIIFQLHVSFSITHFIMKLGKLFKHCRSSMLTHNILTLKLKPLIVDTFRTLIFYDHIVHNHTSCHHLPQLLGARSPSRIPNMPHRDCKTPKARSTSFLALSCSWANLFLFSPTGLGIVFTIVVH